MPTGGWSSVVRWTAALVFVLSAVVGLVTGDRETLVIAAALLVANALLRWRSGIVGTVLAGLLALDIAFWMVPAALTNVVHGEGIRAVAVPALLASASLLLLVAAVLVLLHRSGDRAPLVASGVAAAAVLVAVLAGAFVEGDDRQAGDVEVDLEDTAFVPDEVTVPAGPVAFYVANHDLFWHTFTIEGTGADVRLPTQAHRRVELTLEPGTFRLVCAIPGHESLGMTGTITVE